MVSIHICPAHEKLPVTIPPISIAVKYWTSASILSFHLSVVMLDSNSQYSVHEQLERGLVLRKAFKTRCQK